MQARKIVVLAKSVKNGQNCVAGKCLQTGEWIRPVSTPEGGSLANHQIQCKNPYGSFLVKPLQKVSIDFCNEAPLVNQPENLVISDSLWKQDYKINEHQLPKFIDTPPSLWGEGTRISYKDICSQNSEVNGSLLLVKVADLQLFTSNNKRRVSFIYNGIFYELPATDPLFDSLIEEKPDLQGILCISLGEEYYGYCYKIAAAIY
jgi:hypothetical protein